MLCPLQCPTLVRTCAVISASSGLVDTPAPAHKAPLRWISTPTNVMQVYNSPTAFAAWLVCYLFCCISICIQRSILHVCLAAPMWFCYTMVWYCFVIADFVYAWLLLLQPLRHPLQCPLHVDAWMVEPATLMKGVCPSASEFSCRCHLYQRMIHLSNPVMLDHF